MEPAANVSPSESFRPTPGRDKPKAMDGAQALSRDHSIDLLKGVAICAVVTIHLGSHFLTTQAQAKLATLANLVQWATPSFIFAAGVLYARASLKRSKSWFVTLRSRAGKMLPLFMGVSLAFALAYGAAKAFHLLPGIDVAEPWWERWFNTLLSGRNRLGEQLYFLPYSLLIAGFSIGIVKLLRERLELIAIVAGLLAITSRLFPETYRALPLHPPYREWDMLFSSVAVFLCGFLVERRRDWLLPLLVGALIVSVGTLTSGQATSYRYAGSVALGAALLYYAPRSAFLEWIGRASGTIFLYHTPLLIQPALMLVGKNVPPDYQVVGALLVGAASVLLLAVLHDAVIRSPLKMITFH